MPNKSYDILFTSGTTAEQAIEKLSLQVERLKESGNWVEQGGVAVTFYAWRGGDPLNPQITLYQTMVRKKT